MPRANRHFAKGLVWHLTQRCHRKDFLLKFARDRRRWCYWLFEARRRFGLCVLNYTVTCNHVHLLVRDRGTGEIAAGMQLLAGRTAQEFNRRKHRRGAFWEDRYNATAVETELHLARCLAYIDLNMVRAGVVEHPEQWPDGGYRDLINDRQRYVTVDLQALLEVLDIRNRQSLIAARAGWVSERLAKGELSRDPAWSEAVAVGSEAYVRAVQETLAGRARYRCVVEEPGRHVLRDTEAPSYSANTGPESRPRSAPRVV